MKKITKKRTAIRKRVRSISPPLTDPDAIHSSNLLETSRLGFADLPPELRIKVYRNLFVSELIWLGRLNLALSSQLLRCSKTCLVEGRPILYRENTFYAVRPREIPRFLGTRTSPGPDPLAIKRLDIYLPCFYKKHDIYVLRPFRNLKSISMRKTVSSSQIQACSTSHKPDPKALLSGSHSALTLLLIRELIRAFPTSKIFFIAQRYKIVRKV
jgi:hypothetical protein